MIRRLLFSVLCLVVLFGSSEQFKLDRLRELTNRWSFPTLDFGFDIFDSHTRNSLRRNVFDSSTSTTDECPTMPNPMSVRPGRMHRLYGGCLTFGSNRHSCKGDLVCCRNSEGYNMCQHPKGYGTRIGPDGVIIPPKGLHGLLDDGVSAPAQAKDFCPELVGYCAEDEGPCAVACVDYSSYTKCTDESNKCKSNEVCCKDPCGFDSFCFEVKGKIQKNAPITPVEKVKQVDTISPEKEKPIEKPGIFDEPPPAPQSLPAVASPILSCPIPLPPGHCIGWSEEPGTENGHDGLCKSNDDCKQDKICCAIDSCGKEPTKYCIDAIDTRGIPEGCPKDNIPYVHLDSEGDKCEPHGCSKGIMCCPLAVKGKKFKEMKC